MNVSDLLGSRVWTEDGDSLGRVHDVRAELGARTLKVTGLVVGKWGVLERIGIGAPGSGVRTRSHDVVDWKDVVRADRRGVVVRRPPE